MPAVLAVHVVRSGFKLIIVGKDNFLSLYRGFRDNGQACKGLSNEVGGDIEDPCSADSIH